MLICISSLIKTEIDSKEISLLPLPLYYKLIDAQLLQFSGNSLILTDIPKEDWFVLDQLIDHFQHYEKEFKLEVQSGKNSNTKYSTGKKKIIRSCVNFRVCTKEISKIGIENFNKNQ